MIKPSPEPIASSLPARTLSQACHRLAALAIVFSCLASGSVALASNLTDGMSAYTRHDYKSARVSLEKAIKSNPDDSLAHYYLANTLLFMKDREGAAREYRKGLENANSDEVRDNCQSALKSLQSAGSAPLPAAIKPPTAPAHGGSWSASEDRSSLLQRQAEEGKRAVEEQAQKMQKAITDTAAQRATAVKEEAKQVTDTSDYNWKAARKVRAYNDEINHEAQQQASQLQKTAGQQAEAYKRLREEKNRAFNEAADNLRNQLDAKPGPGGVQLNPNGTSLYVRNYAK